MGILNINSYLIFLIFILYSCNSSKQNKGLPAYHFNELIVLKQDDSLNITDLKMYLRNREKLVAGKIELIKRLNKEKHIKIYFKSIYDTIKKDDTIFVELTPKKKILLTEVQQAYVKTSYTNKKPGFIEYKIDGTKYTEGNGAINF